MTAAFPLDAQLAKLGRILDERVAHYRRAVEKGARPLEWAAAKHAECEAIRRSFAWLAANAQWIRPEAERRQAAQRLAAEAETLRDEPAVAAVLDAIPGAEITEVRPLDAVSD